MITDYASLQASIANWLARVTDTDFVAEVPTFIQLAEQKMFQVLRVREMVCQAQADLNEEYEWLPQGYLDHKYVNILQIKDGTLSTGEITGTYHLSYEDNEEFTRYNLLGSNPAIFTVVGERIRFKPYPDVESGEDSELGYELGYYGEWTSLSDVAPTNPILTKFPHLYLYASMISAELFIIDDERIQNWQALFDRDTAAANRASNDAERGTMAIGRTQ